MLRISEILCLLLVCKVVLSDPIRLIDETHKPKSRTARKIEIAKENSIFDIGDDVDIFIEEYPLTFDSRKDDEPMFRSGYPSTLDSRKDDEPMFRSAYPSTLDSRKEDDIIFMSGVYEKLKSKLNWLHMRLSAVEDQTNAISHRLDYTDCYDYKIEHPHSLTDAYEFHLDFKGKRIVNVLCDMITKGGGWTVIQQRSPREKNGSKIYPDFRRNYHDYKVGFGSPKTDYWLGLENIYVLTNTRQYEARIELEDFSGVKAYAHYDTFYIEEEGEGYKLHVGGYSGNAGDSLSTDVTYDNFTANSMLFSTYDKDQDTSTEINCSAFWDIGGWWFNRCSWANLNGPYRFPEENKDCIGINWHKWRNKQCLRSTKIMIRPKSQG